MIPSPDNGHVGEQQHQQPIYSPCIEMGSDSISSYDPFMDKQQILMTNDKDWADSYDTIELLKQSLEQLCRLTKEQAAAEHATKLQVTGNTKTIQRTNTTSTTASTTTASTCGSRFNRTDIKIDGCKSRSRNVQRCTKTQSRRGSFCSQVSLGSHASSKSVRFGNVSILTAQDIELNEKSIHVTTVDDFEKRTEERRLEHAQKKKQERDENAILDEYVKMAQSTRRKQKEPTTEKKQVTRTMSSSSLSQTDGSKARFLSLLRPLNKEEDSLHAALKSAAATAAARTSSSTEKGPMAHVTIEVEPALMSYSEEKSVRSSSSSKASSKRSKNSNSSFAKMLSKTFGRRQGKYYQRVGNSNDIDISEVTLDDNETETSSNDDSAALMMKDSKGKQSGSSSSSGRSITRTSSGLFGGRTRKTSTVNEGSLEQKPKSTTRRLSRSHSNSSSVASHRSFVLVHKATGLFPRPVSNSSDVSTSVVVTHANSSSDKSIDLVKQEPTRFRDGLSSNNDCHAVEEEKDMNEDTCSMNSSTSSSPVMMRQEDTTQLQHDILDLKRKLMGLVVEHMEESELRKQQKQQLKRHDRLYRNPTSTTIQ